LVCVDACIQAPAQAAESTEPTISNVIRSRIVADVVEMGFVVFRDSHDGEFSDCVSGSHNVCA
jgi:hypothetical protein